MQPNVEIGDIVPETLAEQNAYLARGTEPATLGYIDPVTGAYVQKGLEALPPGFNAPSPNDAENIARVRALIAAQQPEPVKSNLPKNFQLLNAITQNLPGMDAAQVALAMATGYPAALAREIKFPEFADAIQYNPTNSRANDILEGLSKLGERTGPMAEFMVPNRRARTFTPDDFRVAKEMAKTDMAMPLAEMAYNHYMENGIPIPGLPQQFNTPGALYAVKPKGGNNPMNLGSTLPLEQQGEMGKYFSESQITDPMKVFEERLQYHFGDNYTQNQKLREAYEEHIQRRVEENANGVAYSDVNGPAMNELKRKAAEEFVEAAEHARLNGGDPNIKKLYSPSEIEAAAKHYNKWSQGPMKNYVTNLMGTGLEIDPLLKVMNDSPLLPHEIFGTRDRSDDHYIRDAGLASRKDFANAFGGGFNKTPELEEKVKNTVIGKQTATTPSGRYYEDLIDSSLYPKGVFHSPFYNNKKDFPGMEYIKRTDVIPDLMSILRDELGFKKIQNRIFSDILKNKIDPSKLPTRTPANVVQDMIKERVAEMKALQKSKEAYTGWRQENHNTLPSDATFTDVDGNNTGAKLVIFDSKLANENPDLVTRNLAQETKDLNHCVGACGSDNGKFIPMVEPHTGVANKVDSSHGPRYLEQIKKGQISVASLRGPNGESKATFELNPINNNNNKEAPRIRLVQMANGETKYEVNHGWDLPNETKYFYTEMEANKYINDYITKPNQFKVSQLKGKDNRHVIGDEYINDAKNWLNYKHQTGELADFPFNDIKNLPGVYDFSNTDSVRDFQFSQDSKVNQANNLYDAAIRNKLKENPQLSQEYFNGNLYSSQILPELGRFLTADDIINKLAPK